MLAARPGSETQLLPSKLTPPTARSRRVVRPRLLERLDAGLAGRLVLIAAPAGFGKTTLLAEWLATGVARDVAWLALDAGDNDPARFWTYLLAALQMVRPGLRDVSGVPDAPLENLVADIVRELARSDQPLVLILDDFHTVQSAAIHSSMAFLLDHVPANVALVLSTRTDPPLPLARLRARGQLVELRAPDLRFTPAETSAFLGEVMGLQLSFDQVDALEARTEGWVAGLQLAALSLQNRADAQGRAAFVVAFSGTNRFVLDYLMDEVLQQQPDDVLAFLFDTSILERLSGPLCEVVTGDPRSGHHLEMLERANLFLVPLDEDRVWYRYHNLFSEALRHRLARQSPDRVAELHRRASAWYATHGLELLAVDHALAAPDWSVAAQLIDQTLGTLHARGERETIRRWLEQVPADAQRQYPLLLVSVGRDWLYAGEFERAAAAVRDAERLAEAAGENDTLGRALLLEANLANQRGDPARTVACAERARGLLPEDDIRGHASLTVLLASGSLARGNLEAADSILSQAISLADQPVVDWLLRTDRGLLHALRGQLPRAVHVHEALLREVGDLPVVYAVEQRWRLAVLHLELNELDVAERYLSDALASLERFHAEVFRARIHLSRARLFFARGNLDAASVALDEAEAAAARVGNALHQRWAQAYRARLRLLRGDLAGAEAWASGVRSDAALLEPEHEPEALVFARVELARGQSAAAFNVLANLLQRADSAGHEWNAIGVLVLQAVAADGRGDREAANVSLRSALQRGAPGGFRRVFLEEGSALAPVLRRVRSAAPALVAELLAVVDESSLASPISAREREVLALVAAGLSNREIAEQLIVAPNTVKAHVRHLGTKLGASSRTQLLARARDLGLL